MTTTTSLLNRLVLVVSSFGSMTWPGMRLSL